MNSSTEILPQSGMVSKRVIRLLFGLSVSGICVYYLLGAVSGEKVITNFSTANFKLLFFAFLITSFSYVLRSYRWKFLFSDVSLRFSHSYRCLTLGFFMNNVLPARIGEFVRAHSLGKIIGESRAKVLATVAIERLLDGVMLSLFFAILFPLWSGNSENASLLYKVSYLFALASVGTFVVLVFRKLIFKILKFVDSKMGISGVSYIIRKTEKFIIGLEPLTRLRLLIPSLMMSVVIWGVELWAYDVIARAFSLELNPGSLALFLVAVNFSSLVPAAPGGIGTIETFASFALAKIGIQHEVALAMVLAQHIIQFISVGIPGLFYTINKYNGEFAGLELDEVSSS